MSGITGGADLLGGPISRRYPQTIALTAEHIRRAEGDIYQLGAHYRHGDWTLGIQYSTGPAERKVAVGVIWAAGGARAPDPLDKAEKRLAALRETLAASPGVATSERYQDMVDILVTAALTQKRGKGVDAAALTQVLERSGVLPLLAGQSMGSPLDAAEIVGALVAALER